jgi:hypothetical protein
MSPENNNTITASRMGSILRCPRAHFWRYEVGLVKDVAGPALRIGSGWAKLLELWNRGNPMEQCFELACKSYDRLDEYQVAMLCAMFRGYVRRWGNKSVVAEMAPEEPFRYPLEGSKKFDVAGVLDALGILRDRRTAFIESKSSGVSVATESHFWLRLRFNPQVLQYVCACREFGWDVSMVIYDVMRKPCIKPKQVTDVDADGHKIVIDNLGQRVLKKDGSPRETPDHEKGYMVKSHFETPEEYGERLFADTCARPDFYFARREVTVLDYELESFKLQRLAIGRMIVHFRSNEPMLRCREDAWPRAVSEMNCGMCEYKDFCLQNTTINLAEPPDGFAIKPFNPELERSYNDAAQEATDAAE